MKSSQGRAQPNEFGSCQLCRPGIWWYQRVDGELRSQRKEFVRGRAGLTELHLSKATFSVFAVGDLNLVLVALCMGKHKLCFWFVIWRFVSFAFGGSQ